MATLVESGRRACESWLLEIRLFKQRKKHLEKNLEGSSSGTVDWADGILSERRI